MGGGMGGAKCAVRFISFFYAVSSSLYLCLLSLSLPSTLLSTDTCTCTLIRTELSNTPSQHYVLYYLLAFSMYLIYLVSP